jgi:hypothetical protein
MDSKTLFLLGCIPTRIGLAFLAKYISDKYLIYWGLVVLAISIGFLYLFFTGNRKTGIETGGKPIWWMNFRIFHGLMYLAAAFFAFQKDGNSAFQIVLVDTLVGLVLFVNQHFIKMDLF